MINKGNINKPFPDECSFLARNRIIKVNNGFKAELAYAESATIAVAETLNSFSPKHEGFSDAPTSIKTFSTEGSKLSAVTFQHLRLTGEKVS